MAPLYGISSVQSRSAFRLEIRCVERHFGLKEVRLLVECQNCAGVVDAVNVCRYTRELEDEYPDSVHLFKCPRCLNPILVEVDDIAGDGKQFNILYPSAPKASVSVPEDIRKTFDEAMACLRAKAYTAASIMCRKTLEGICEVHGAKDKGLVNGLKGLRERSIIESRLFEWADALRIQGNEAAHDVRVNTSAQDAKDIVEFTHALLEYVFTFNDKFEEFRRRRTKRNEAAAH